MAFTAVTALIAGAEVTATVVLAAVAEIGTVMTVVGAVTGSKELMKIGGAMALVGGVGGMVNGALSGATAVAGEGIDAASQAAADAYGGASGAEASQAAGIEAMGGASDAASSMAADGAGGVADLSTGPVTTQSPSAEMNVAQEQATTGPDRMAPNGADTGPQQAPIVQGAQTPQGPVGAVTPNAPVTPYDNPTDIRLAGGTQTAPQSSGSFWNSFSDFANKNKTLLGGAMQLGGGLLKGMSDRQMWDQKMALEQQRISQTGYGNSVSNTAPNPRPGIIQSAQGARA